MTRWPAQQGPDRCLDRQPRIEQVQRRAQQNFRHEQRREEKSLHRFAARKTESAPAPARRWCRAQLPTPLQAGRRPGSPGKTTVTKAWLAKKASNQCSVKLRGGNSKAALGPKDTAIDDNERRQEPDIGSDDERRAAAAALSRSRRRLPPAGASGREQRAEHQRRRSAAPASAPGWTRAAS